jgi:WD40 repeat protein
LVAGGPVVDFFFTRNWQYVLLRPADFIDIWEVPLGRLVWRGKATTSDKTTTRGRYGWFSPDSQWAAIRLCDDDGYRLKLVHVQDGILQHSLKLDENNGLSWIEFPKSSDALAMRLADNTVNLVDLNNGKITALRAVSRTAVASYPRSEVTRFSDDGKMFAASDRGCVHIWNTSESRPVATHELSGAEVVRLEFSPTNELLAVVGQVQLFKSPPLITLVRVFDGQVLSRFVSAGRMSERLQFNEDGDKLLVKGAGVGLASHWQVFGVPDGQCLATVTIDSSALDDGIAPNGLHVGPIQVLNGHAFTPDLRFLATAGEHHLVQRDRRQQARDAEDKDCHIRLWRLPALSALGASTPQVEFRLEAPPTRRVRNRDSGHRQ